MTAKIIDGHRHITCPEAIRIASQLDPKKSSDFYPPGIHEASAMINRKLAGEGHSPFYWSAWNMASQCVSRHRKVASILFIIT